MNAARFAAVMEVFEAASDLPGDARSRLLDERCPDAAFRAEVESLLRHHDAADNAADHAVHGAQAAVAAIPEVGPAEHGMPLPEQIAGYRIIRILGSGGMGVVYEAEQVKPLRRVALKVIHGHGASPALVQRFEREAELLARLQHRGIAQVFAAGMHEGVPYLAMELVLGRPLDFAARTLNWRARVALFVKVCDAVAHAHAQGVVHRDLKPSNVLVDEAGEPKVLDFGVARALDDDSTEPGGANPLLTRTGQLVGTLEFMSPEQLAGDSSRIDGQSDVYALGVILYALLADRLPFDLSGQPITEAILTLRDREAPRLAQVAPFLAADIVTIVDTAMAKDKGRRYATVAVFAADLRRFLNDEPIAARPPSAFYVLQKFARRHRSLVTASALVFAATLTGLVVSLRMYFLADQRAREAQRQANIATAVRSFLVGVFADANPQSNPRANELSLRQLLAAAAERATQRFATEPELECSIRATLGETFVGLGAYDEAEREYRRAIALAGTAPQRLTDLRIACATLEVTRGRAAEAEAVARELVAVATAQGDPQLRAHAHNALGGALQAMYRWADAEAEFAREIEFEAEATGRESSAYARALVNRAAVRLSQHDNAGAERDLTEALPLLERWYGSTSSHTLVARHNMAGLAIQTGDLPRAERELREVCAAEATLFGAEHPERAHSLNGLGVVLTKRGDFVAAEGALRDAVAMLEKSGTADGGTLAMVLTNLAYLRGKREEYADAAQLYQRAFALRAATGARASMDAVRAQFDLARIQGLLDDVDGEIATLQRALAMARSLATTDDPTLIRKRADLVQKLRAVGRHDEAAAIEAGAMPAPASSSSR